MPRLSRKWIWVLGIVAAAVLLVVILSYLTSSERLRRYVQNEMNRHLEGYTVQVGRAQFNPIAFALYLGNVAVIQNANPDPPVAGIAGMRASLHWRDLLRGHIVGELVITRPRLFVNLAHFRAEQHSSVPIQKKGWQDALQAIYPIKINEFRVDDGDLTYVDEGPYRPLHAGRIQLRASNIRNIISPENVYPSTVHLEGRIFDKGALTLDGKADFLREPHMAFKGDVDLRGMDLSYFQPILVRSNISIRSGTLSTAAQPGVLPQAHGGQRGRRRLRRRRCRVHSPAPDRFRGKAEGEKGDEQGRGTQQHA